MKRMLIVLFLSLFSLSLFAPGYSVCYIKADPGIHHDPILRAFMFVESSFRVDVVNYLGYSGILQIGAEMTAEANRINSLTGRAERYTFPASALDSAQSVAIWYVAQNWHNPGYDVKRCAQIWNPLASKKYLNKILKQL